MMLKATVEKRQKDLLVIKLDGVVDDSLNLENDVGQPPLDMRMDCSGVTRLNSQGVKAWMVYFGGPKFRGTNLELFNCSPAIVHQLNMIANFACGGKVTSIQVPFSCSRCSEFFSETLPVHKIKADKFEVGDRKCPKCGSLATFDDLPSSYFGFMMRGKT